MLDFNLKLIEHNGIPYYTRDLLDELKGLGIQKGDILCVHSQIFNLGKPLLPKHEFLHELVLILEELVGEEGTLIMPAFSYSFCNGEIFDVMNTPSTVGILTECFRREVGVKRTHHPNFSFSVWGKKQNEFLDVGPDAFGFDSVYGKMMRNGGKILMLGANIGYTFYYLAEEHVQVTHRYFKVFEGEIKDGNSKKQVTVPYFVRKLDRNSEFSEAKLVDYLLEKKIQKQKSFGKGTLAIFDCLRMYEAVVEVLKEDNEFFL